MDDAAGSSRPPSRLRAYGGAVVKDPSLLWHFGLRSVEAVRRFGVGGLWEVILTRLQRHRRRSYLHWVRRYDTLRPGDEAAALETIASWKNPPLISLVVATHGEGPAALEHTVSTIQSQWYGHWELLVVGGLSAGRERFDPRLVEIEGAAEEGLAASYNRALARARGDWLGVVPTGGRLSPDALCMFAREARCRPDAVALYSDEDEIGSDGKRGAPSFKPDWDPDLLLSIPFNGHLTLYRRAFLRELGGWGEGREGVEDWDLALRASARACGDAVGHIPHVLYHGPSEVAPRAAPPSVVRAMLEQHLRHGQGPAVLHENGAGWQVRYELPSPPPRVSIIVPTRKGVPLLRRCVESVRARTRYPDFELLVIDNQCRGEANRDYLRELSQRPNVRVLPFAAPFNFSAMNNFAAREATGSVLVLLNDDTEVLAEEWLLEMVGHAQRDEVGVVGAKLYYPEGTIQHAGVVLGLGWVAGHLLRGSSDEDGRAARWAHATRSVSAVTGACLAVRRDLYLQVGGLDEAELPISFNDIDLCLRLRARGYRIVWTPHAKLIHDESATRGPDHTPGKAQRLRREEAVMHRRWGELLASDPAYNPNLALSSSSPDPSFPPRVRRPWARRGRWG